MAIKQIDLNMLHNEPAEVQEAVAFYTSYSYLPVRVSQEEREHYYSVLEEAGYIEKVGVGNGEAKGAFSLSHMSS